MKPNTIKTVELHKRVYSANFKVVMFEFHLRATNHCIKENIPEYL